MGIARGRTLRGGTRATADKGRKAAHVRWPATVAPGDGRCPNGGDGARYKAIRRGELPSADDDHQGNGGRRPRRG